MNDIYRQIGTQLRQIREEKKLTLQEVGKKAGVSYTYISEIERGKTSPSIKTLEKIAYCLGISITDFLKIEDDYSLGSKIRRLREKQNLTQFQLAHKIGVSYSLIGQIETGRVKPALDTLQKIAAELGVSVYYFLLSEEDEKKLNRKTIAPEEGQYEKIVRLFENLTEKEQEFIIQIINIFINFKKTNIKENENPKIKQLFKIISKLSEEDLDFVLENAKWLLKKSNLS